MIGCKPDESTCKHFTPGLYSRLPASNAFAALSQVPLLQMKTPEILFPYFEISIQFIIAYLQSNVNRFSAFQHCPGHYSRIKNALKSNLTQSDDKLTCVKLHGIGTAVNGQIHRHGTDLAYIDTAVNIHGWRGKRDNINSSVPMIL